MAFELKNRKYSIDEKERLATLAEKYKIENEKQSEEGEKVWDRRRKKFVQKATEVMKEGYLAKAVREVYPSLKDAKSTDLEFEKALKVAKRALEKREMKRKSGEIVDMDSGSKKRFREAGGGRKAQAEDVRQAVFDWFIDVRGTLKGRLPVKVFKAKCKDEYEKWLEHQENPPKEEDRLQFTKRWIYGWMREYGVSLLKPNKRFQISKDDRVERILELIKNILRVRYFFLHNFNKEPEIINGDQMPLHRNESAGQKTLSIKNQDVFVKENYMLSRERATVFTQVSTRQDIKPEMLFKGKGVRIKVSPPEGMNVQFAPKGSYRLEHMLKMVSTLQNRFNMFTCKDYAVYILDDYSVHTMKDLKVAFQKRGYILIIIGGGVTGDIQVNDTHVHHRLKGHYRDLETRLMLDKLRIDPNKIPSPSRDEMMEMLLTSWRKQTMTCINPLHALKENFLCNALDGSEDYLVRDKLFQLVGESVKEFRKELMSSPPPKSLSELLTTLTPPKGVHTKAKASSSAAPPDEGRELLDCEGEELEGEIENVESSDEEREQTSTSAERQPTDKAPPSAVAKMQTLPTDTPDESINIDARMVNDLSSLLENYKGQTSSKFLPYYCQLSDTLQKARRSLKKRVHLSRTKKALEAREQTGSQSTSTQELEPVASTSRQELEPVASTSRQELEPVASTSRQETTSTGTTTELIPSDSDAEEEDVNPALTPGQYVQIQLHGHSTPACIVSVEPLSVRYFEKASSGMFQAGEVLSCQGKNIVSIIDAPEIVCIGSRTVHYKF